MRKELEILQRKNAFLILHNEVSESELDRAMCDADILISIGNKDSDFLPSKTLKYMGTGKPIIHFYSDDNDVSLNYYKYYPAVLFIDQRREINDSLIDEVVDFVQKTRIDINVDFDELKSNLIKNTPEYTAKQLMELING